ncbi:pyridoxal-phosphate dependent enzyme family protein [Rhodococcus sp. MTM3W5.2]|nr:pyridoxal-phosphate dependent enzyme family protein [Rhodococcus sp. MTM3W5.2]
MVGNTPVLWIGEPFADAGRGFWAKLEGANPGGMKDRPALHMVERAKLRGDLAPGAMIIESTSGTLGLGLALAGIVHRHPVTLVTDPGMEPIVHHLLAACGARVELVTEPHATGGWQQARRDRVHQLLVRNPGSWCPDQYQNPDNVDAYGSLALELIAQLGRVDVLVCSVGTGGTRRAWRGCCASTAPISDWWGSTRSARRFSASRREPGSCAASVRASTPRTSTTRRSMRSIGWRRRRRCGRAGPWPRPITRAAGGASGPSR